MRNRERPQRRKGGEEKGKGGEISPRDHFQKSAHVGATQQQTSYTHVTHYSRPTHYRVLTSTNILTDHELVATKGDKGPLLSNFRLGLPLTQFEFHKHTV